MESGPLPGGAAPGRDSVRQPRSGEKPGFGQRVSSVVKGPGTVAASLTYCDDVTHVCDDVSSCRLSYHIAGLVRQKVRGPEVGHLSEVSTTHS